MKNIWLTQGQVAIVDDEDYEMLSAYNWYAVKIKGGFYARRSLSAHGKSYKHIMMHRVIMGVDEESIFVDHRDRNGLNNQKSNLRFATVSQNACNKKTQKNNSGHKGVYFRKSKNIFQASLRINGKPIYLGSSKDVLVCAKMYNDAAIKYFGEFAKLNEL
jgi:hypothetical protein